MSTTFFQRFHAGAIDNKYQKVSTFEHKNSNNRTKETININNNNNNNNNDDEDEYFLSDELGIPTSWNSHSFSKPKKTQIDSKRQDTKSKPYEEAIMLQDLSKKKPQQRINTNKDINQKNPSVIDPNQYSKPLPLIPNESRPKHIVLDYRINQRNIAEKHIEFLKLFENTEKNISKLTTSIVESNLLRVNLQRISFNLELLTQFDQETCVQNQLKLRALRNETKVWISTISYQIKAIDEWIVKLIDDIFLEEKKKNFSNNKTRQKSRGRRTFLLSNYFEENTYTKRPTFIVSKRTSKDRRRSKTKFIKSSSQMKTNKNWWKFGWNQTLDSSRRNMAGKTNEEEQQQLRFQQENSIIISNQDFIKYFESRINQLRNQFLATLDQIKQDFGLTRKEYSQYISEQYKICK